MNTSPHDSQSPPLILVAHRGWPTRFPENSLAGFIAAIEAGAREIELDVWASRDGVPFICHDPTLERTTALNGRCDAFDIAEIRQTAIRHPDGELLPDMGLPTLVQALELCTPRVAVNIHVKDPGPDTCILHALNDFFQGRRPECGSYIAGDRKVLEEAARVCPAVPRCCLEGQNDGELLIDNALDLGCERLQFFSGHYTRQAIDRARENNLVTNLFWCDDPDEIATLWQQGIIAPLTNDIGAVHHRLAELGLVR